MCFSRRHVEWREIFVYIVISEDSWHSLVAERLAVKLSLPVLTTVVCQDRDSASKTSVCEANTLTDYDTTAARFLKKEALEIVPNNKYISAKLWLHHYIYWEKKINIFYLIIKWFTFLILSSYHARLICVWLNLTEWFWRTKLEIKFFNIFFFLFRYNFGPFLKKKHCPKI